MSPCCRLTGGLASAVLKVRPPKSYRQLPAQMAELQDTQLKATTFMFFICHLFNDLAANLDKFKMEEDFPPQETLNECYIV